MKMKIQIGTAVIVVGLLSSLIAALMALVATDLKRVLAYSTISQLGYMVTAVGAGAICAATLLILYPKLSAMRVVGADLAHAVPLTLVGGLGHLALGNVDFMLLSALLVGSIPAIHLGARSASKMPDYLLRPMLASTLLGLGIKYALF